jgi:hypothetical protein
MSQPDVPYKCQWATPEQAVDLGDSPVSRQKVTMSLADFSRFFAGRGIAIA